MQRMEDLITSLRYPLTLVSTLFAVAGLRKVFNHWRTHRRKIPQNEARVDLQETLMSLETRKPGNIWNTVLFFPDYFANELDSTTQQFFWYFAEAKISIRICIYNFNLPQLESILIQQYDKGLIVQLIVGNDHSAKSLREKANLPCGVVPRKSGTPDTDQIMHHKFALIDDEAVITGSMNWTIDGFMNNTENMCVTTQQNTVQLYQKEFFKLLKLSEDAKTFYY